MNIEWFSRGLGSPALPCEAHNTDGYASNGGKGYKRLFVASYASCFLRREHEYVLEAQSCICEKSCTLV